MHREFDSKILNEQGSDKMVEINNAFGELLDRLLKVCGPPSRELSLCRTKLEEASFFAKKAMAFDTGNSAP